MVIWGAMAIPVLFAIVLLVKFQHKTVWWEFTIPFAVSIVLIAGNKSCVETMQTSDTEFWGGIAQNAEYYERWDEEVPCTHIKYCTKTRMVSDGNGGTKSETYQEPCGTEHLYDVDDHPPRWVVNDDNGQVVSISSGKFEELAKRFGNRQFVDMHRSYHSIDGDKYVAKWGGDEETLEPVFTSHSYENRVQASNSVFNFTEVSESDKKGFGLFDYPGLSGYSQRSILGNGGATQAKAEELLSKANARLGRSKQARIFILVFDDQPQQAGLLQENFWKRGNKNELVITVGVNKAKEVQWAYVFSWTEVEELKIELRDYVSTMGTLDLVSVVETAVPLVQKKWVRKRFRDFSYLTVEPPGWAVALTYLLTLAVNLGLSFWIVGNQHQEWTPRRGRYGDY